MSTRRIEPRLLKGFRDYLPETCLVRQSMIQRLSEIFRSFGYAPIETPALEYTEILLGKGSEETDKQMFRFLDNGERDVAMRFDLTVPLARFAALHQNEIGSPFRRFHIAPVWRAEKPQRGRYREFIQCDFDILGTRSVFADAEILAIVHAALNALHVAHSISFNNRFLLNGLLETLQAKDCATAVLRAIDKLEKQGRESVAAELQAEARLSLSQVEAIFHFVALSSQSPSPQKTVEELRALLRGSETGQKGISDVEALIGALNVQGVPESAVRLDLSIARGLDYYTGTVFETSFNELPDIGSICSGGRYDNLVSLYSSRELPGVGGSFGLDRILAALEELQRLPKRSTPAQVLITMFDEGSEPYVLSLAHRLRSAGIPTELYPELGKLGNQLKYAARRGIELAVIAGRNEASTQSCALKILQTGEQRNDVPSADLPQVVQSLLSER